MNHLDVKWYDKAFPTQALRRISGERFGIELEVENCRIRNLVVPEHWVMTKDGSLRNVGYEFILTPPLTLDKLTVALKGWYDEIGKRLGAASFSPRTSVHIHVNAMGWTIYEVYKTLCLYYLVENTLLRTQPVYRHGNLYCLRLADAHRVVFDIIDDVQKRDHFADVARHIQRYGALNVASLRQHGTLEFRFISGTNDIELIQGWVDIFRSLYHKAHSYATCHDILAVINENDPLTLLEWLPENKITKEIQGFNEDQLREDIVNNYSFIMFLASAVDGLQGKQETPHYELPWGPEDLDQWCAEGDE